MSVKKSEHGGRSTADGKMLLQILNHIFALNKN